MDSKKILGLDLGTNSIGWALISHDAEKREGKILGLGSRIVPMSQDVLNDFGNGGLVSQTADRTWFRSIRRLRERSLLRRQRLHRVLNVLGFLPEHYRSTIDFERKLGQFYEGMEPKIAHNKGHFLFENSFREMLSDFKQHQPQLLIQKNRIGSEAKVPYDWTIYYLRKKALTQKITKEELAWIILNFNQKRGYYQLRGEDETRTDVREYVLPLTIIGIEKGERDKKNASRFWYSITLSNGWIHRATFTTEPNWLNSEKDFLVTEELDEFGQIKISKEKNGDSSGSEKRKFTPLPSFEEIDSKSKAEQDKIYKKIKAKTEITIQNSNKTVGSYIYDTLLAKPDQKIRGKLVRTIERKFYKDELKQILMKQSEFHAELRDQDLLNSAIRELYRNNIGHQELLSGKDFTHLILEDIIFYQRPLRSKKSAISNCPLERRIFKNSEGELQLKSLKVVPKSNPYYQEFRVWQWLHNLKIYLRDNDLDVTSDFLGSSGDWADLFDYLMTKEEVDQTDVLKFLLMKKGVKGAAFKTESRKYRWNYIYDPVKDTSKAYPCNKTRYEIHKRLEKVKDCPAEFLTFEREYDLWHLIYSVTEKGEYEKALKSFATKNHLDVSSFVEHFLKFQPFKSEYGAFSEKAIKKLLPMLRIGPKWNWNDIDINSRSRIDKILTGEFDENIKNRVREKAINLKKDTDFQGLQLWLASYIVYDRHAESSSAETWHSVDDLYEFLKEFKQHSLRNPIVEQIIMESLRVVGDVWKTYGKSGSRFFDEIHIELGREMKNTKEERKNLTQNISENENTNRRIESLLKEFMNDPTIEGVRSYSPQHSEKLKIYEEGVLKNEQEIPDEIALTLKKFNDSDAKKRPTNAEIAKYKLWLDQKYRSPYTGQIIPLNKLFTAEYNIEHVIPQSRYFDDSISNKVVCETAVNQLKNNRLGLEFIQKHGGELLDIGFGKTVRILLEDEYTELVKYSYSSNYSKRNKLLLSDIPDVMIQRQLNDTRYVSKYIGQLLSNIVREGLGDDGVNSKNILQGNGKVTAMLKKDWGLNNVWNSIILPRFERMNELTNSKDFTTKNKEGHIIPVVPFEYSKGFQKKRIDHRHHAMDALIMACTTRNHINLLNNQSAKSETTRYDLQNKLRNKGVWTDGQGVQRTKFEEFKLPWNTFLMDTKVSLEKVIVSFKQNLRIINKATNYYWKWEEKDGKVTKVLVPQEGLNWAIRKPMHKDTVSGKVTLPHVKVEKGKILTATRKSLDSSFDLKSIETITDTGIQKILRNYLMQEKFKIKDTKGNIEYDSESAFSPEGIDFLNRNIKKFNDGVPHKPIYKVRIFEKGSKFPIGQKGNKSDKYVEAAKGTNLFFAIYVDDLGKRSYETIPLNLVIERQKQGLNSVPEKNDKGHRLLLHLSPNDLVYVPDVSEVDSNLKNLDSQISLQLVSRIYKMVSCTGSECHFIQVNVASLIKTYDSKSKIGEMGSLNKLETTISKDSVRIKEVCVKIRINRIGEEIIE